MATGAEAVSASFNKYLKRDPGQTGLDYWAPEWEENKQKGIDSGMSEEQAEAQATALLDKNLGLSDERHGLISSDDYDRSELGIPDEFTFHEEKSDRKKRRSEDWAKDVVSTNAELYISDLNDQYGLQQGNVIGQEGLDWWSWQLTQNTQSNLAQGDDYDTAYSKAMATVERDISKNRDAINYEKYGSVGYGSPLEISTGVTDHGVHTTEKAYLNLSPLTNLNPTGTLTAQGYELDEDGAFKVDDDGNYIPTGDPSTPFEWKYVEDATAPGGYRIEPVAFTTGSVAGQKQIMDRYHGSLGEHDKTFIYTPYENIDASGFTDGTYDYASWKDTPAGREAIAAGDYSIKNKTFQSRDGYLYNTPDNFDHTKYDSNLGLGPNERLKVDWGGGYLTGYTPDGKPFTPTPEFVYPNQSMMIGGGNNINLETSQKSTTAADQLVKQDDRGQASGQRKKEFQNKIKPTGNVRQLGIVSADKKASVPAV